MDYDKAKSLYEKAVLAGNAQAMNNLGQMYENARGTWRDYTKAKSLYEQAAAAGNQEATLNLTKVRNLEKLNAPK
jgi:TPR repeat protein